MTTKEWLHKNSKTAYTFHFGAREGVYDEDTQEYAQELWAKTPCVESGSRLMINGKWTSRKQYHKHSDYKRRSNKIELI